MCQPLSLSLTLQVTPTATLQTEERGTPLLEGEGTDEEDTLQPTQVDLSVAAVCSVGDRVWVCRCAYGV